MPVAPSLANSVTAKSERRRFPALPPARALRRWLVPVALLALWEVSSDTGLVDSYYLPPLHVVLQTAWSLLLSGQLLDDTGVSLYRLFAGYASGAIAGIVVGVVTGRSALAFDLLDPVIQALRPISPIALLPLAIVYLGVGDFEKIMLIAYSTFFPVVINTYFGVRGVDPVVLMAARTLGATRRLDMLREIILPAALPHIFSGLRVSLGISFIVLIAAEMIAAHSGLGFRILDAEQVFEINVVYVGIVVISLLGLLFDAVFMRVRRRVLPWYRET
jgi:ABC-type nitrate/sulfonate/bicarbonate transport system permease component